jgi:hypothetical protein
VRGVEAVSYVLNAYFSLTSNLSSFQFPISSPPFPTQFFVLFFFFFFFSFPSCFCGLVFQNLSFDIISSTKVVFLHYFPASSAMRLSVTKLTNEERALDKRRKKESDSLILRQTRENHSMQEKCLS